MKVLLLVTMIALSGCSVMEVLGMLKPYSGLSVDTEIVAGDKQIDTEVTVKKETTTNTAESITQTYTTVNEADNYVPWVVAVIGFLLPTPTRLYYLWKNRGKKNGR